MAAAAVPIANCRRVICMMSPEVGLAWRKAVRLLPVSGLPFVLAVPPKGTQLTRPEANRHRFDIRALHHDQPPRLDVLLGAEGLLSRIRWSNARWPAAVAAADRLPRWRAKAECRSSQSASDR